MSISKIEIKNFTVFKDISIGLSDRVNVFVGENGTGKTHLLKVLYAANILHSEGHIVGIKDLFGGGPSFVKGCDFNINNLITPWSRTFKADFRSGKIELAHPEAEILIEANSKGTSLFIPAKDMLTHSKGLLAMAKKHSKEMPFDRTLLDIIEKASQWKVDDIPEIAKNLVPFLEREMGGKVRYENDTFHIEKHNGEMVDFAREAEGVKKLGLLWQLLMNENIKKGSLLLWDEPEANINPKLIPDLVEILLELSRNGVQIFLATHDYFLPKYIEVLAKENDEVAFHSLYTTESEGVKCETQSKFSFLEHNAIIDEKIRLYETEIEAVTQ